MNDLTINLCIENADQLNEIVQNAYSALRDKLNMESTTDSGLYASFNTKDATPVISPVLRLNKLSMEDDFINTRLETPAFKNLSTKFSFV